MKPLRVIYLSIACTLGAANAMAQDVELGFYSGWQTSPHSEVEGTRPDGSRFSETFGWEGNSLEAPPYYGLRATWWRSETIGVGLEFTHAKVYAVKEDLDAAGFTRFEMTDGLNILTVNALRRWPQQFGGLTPYIGGGLGIAFPHVDVTTDNGDKTFEYQLTGPAARVMAGASYDINQSWAVFGEYQGTYSSHDADLDPEGSFETDIITNALNMGVSFNF